ncbi:MAG: 4'-phosphopantetheinyl transferase superfamily protein [Alphaproteobacteria bacterium]|nr:4'-phosphopantetheinyl transferase superfamily protein [Alphaproteobacteria bacterium]
MVSTIEVWWAQIDGDPPSDWQAVLSPDEIAAATAPRQPSERLRRIATRYFLRDVLSRSLGVSAGRLCFGRHSGGKPFVLYPGCSGFEFSLSHSSGLAAVAVAERISVGIDIERIDPRLRWHALAHVVIHPARAAELHGFAEPERMRILLQLWTRREAAAKASGAGLGAARSGEMSNDAAGMGLFVRDLPAPPDYVAALAAAPEPIQIVNRHWTRGFARR